MTERKKARKKLPRVAVHLGETVQTVQTARSGKTNKYNFLKMSSNQGRPGFLGIRYSGAF